MGKHYFVTYVVPSTRPIEALQKYFCKFSAPSTECRVKMTKATILRFTFNQVATKAHQQNLSSSLSACKPCLNQSRIVNASQSCDFFSCVCVCVCVAGLQSDSEPKENERLDHKRLEPLGCSSPPNSNVGSGRTKSEAEWDSRLWRQWRIDYRRRAETSRDRSPSLSSFCFSSPALILFVVLTQKWVRKREHENVEQKVSNINYINC